MIQALSRRELRIAAILYFLAVAAYALPSGRRIRQHTNDNHYVHLAYGWLHGRLDLGGPPPHSNDWAQLDWVWTKDGKLHKGQYLPGSAEQFKNLRGKLEAIPAGEVEKKETKYYVSFPPFPGLVMLPVVAIAGMGTNDVLFTVLLAALVPALLFLLLRTLAARRESDRSEADDLWLTGVLAVGSVFYFSAVRGEVWYTAHVVSVLCCILYAWASIGAARPALAGFALVAGFLCRPELLFAAPLFLAELYRVHRADRGAMWRTLIRFGVPIAVFGLAAAALNVARFGRPTEFGHTYLNVIQAGQIQKYGLFNFTYLGRNLACAFALTPSIVAGHPWIRVSWHGLAMWVTTPVLFYLLWPLKKGVLHRPLWITVACVAIPDLFYQNSGWVQFGYRFSLDYMVFLVMLLALGGRKLTPLFKALCVYAFAINLFGAITFYWAGDFYFNSYFPPGIN